MGYWSATYTRGSRKDVLDVVDVASLGIQACDEETLKKLPGPG